MQIQFNMKFFSGVNLFHNINVMRFEQMFFLIPSSIEGRIAIFTFVILDFSVDCLNVRLQFLFFMAHMATMLTWVVLGLFVDSFDVNFQPCLVRGTKITH
jgi:hypothetical protein